MFYQYNNFTGRLIGSKQFQPYFPVGVQPTPNAEPPKVTFADPHTTIAKESPRLHRGAGGELFGGVAQALRDKQTLFQQHNKLPVHLKGGPADRILFGITVALCGLSLAGCFQVYYELSVPKK